MYSVQDKVEISKGKRSSSSSEGEEKSGKRVCPEVHVDLIAAFISASGGDISDFKLSIATGYRTREKVASLVTEKDKSDFRNICQDKSKKLIVYFDGKLVHKQKMDRVAMLVRSQVQEVDCVF